METPGDALPGPPPALFDRPVAARPWPEPLAGSEVVAALHRRWAQLRGQPERDPADAQAARAVGGVRAKVRARVVNAAAGVQAAERAMTGDLVRALDAVAQRIDELAGRVADLEHVVQEVVDTVSEDLVRIHEAAADVRAAASPTTPGADGPHDARG